VTTQLQLINIIIIIRTEGHTQRESAMPQMRR